jgi:hypothetical protein
VSRISRFVALRKSIVARVDEGRRGAHGREIATGCVLQLRAHLLVDESAERVERGVDVRAHAISGVTDS